jgi:CubicO group peptidase (beta-lactamase class C family)
MNTPAAAVSASVTGQLQGHIQGMLDRFVAQGPETSLQVAAYLDGRLIVDAWAGTQAGPGSRAVDADTLFPVYSVSKGITATAAHRLVERGILGLDVPIVRYWPEFAAHGKEGITLRHVLSHTAGLAKMHEDGTMDDLVDWDGMCARFAAMPPLHAPGERRHYHAISYSWLVGEVARRADGRDFKRIIAEEVAAPLGLTGLYIGIPEGVDHLVVLPVAGPAAPPSATPPAPPDPVGMWAIPPYVLPLERMMVHRGVQRACIGASNGLMNARSIAKHYAALIGDGVDGVRLLSEATVDEATMWYIPHGPDGRNAGRFGLGYGLSGPDAEPGAIFGHGGYGGANGFADRSKRLAVGVTKGRMCGGEAPGQIVAEIRRLTGT